MQNTEEHRFKIAHKIADAMELDDMLAYVRQDLMDQMEKDDEVFKSFAEDIEYEDDDETTD